MLDPTLILLEQGQSGWTDFYAQGLKTISSAVLTDLARYPTVITIEMLELAAHQVGN